MRWQRVARSQEAHEVMVASCKAQDFQVAKEKGMRTVFVCTSWKPHHSRGESSVIGLGLAASYADFVVCNRLQHPGLNEGKYLTDILDQMHIDKYLADEDV